MKNAILLTSIIIAFFTGFVVRTSLTEQKIDVMAEISDTDRNLAKEQIRRTESSYDSAWQQGDIEGLLACFTDDAVLISPRGDEAFGKDQIRKLFNGFLSGEAKNTKHTTRITRIKFATNDVAIVDGEAFIEGGGNLSSPVKHHGFVDILVRKGNVWLISQIRAYAIK